MRSSRWSSALVAGLMLLVVAGLWLPFGFILPLHEPWLLHAQYQAGDIPTVTLTGIRSLHYMVPYAAYLLSPDNFLGYHALQILGFWAKGFLLYLILRKLLPENRGLAVLAGVLLIIFPADNGIFIQQATLHHIGLSLMLLASYLFLIFRERRNGLLFALVLVCQWASISIYEAGLPLMLVFPLLVVWLERRLNRRTVLLAAGWLVVPILWAAIIVSFLITPTTDNSYVRNLAQTDSGGGETISLMLSSLVKVYRDHFLVPWAATLQDFRVIFNNLPTLVATAAIVAGLAAAALVILRQKGTESGWRRLAVVVLVGLVLTGVGFAMYLPTELRNTSIRTYFYTAIGAATATAALITLVSRIFQGRLRTAVFALLAGGVIFVAFVRDLRQYDTLAFYADRQKAFVTNIVRAAPGLEAGTLLYLYGDETVQPADVAVETYYEGFVFAYLYEDYSIEQPRAGYFVKGCLYTVIPNPNEQATCVPTDAGVLITDVMGERVIPYSAIVAVQFDKAGNVRLLEQLPAAFGDAEALAEYQPYNHLDTDAPYPRHAQSVLGM